MTTLTGMRAFLRDALASALTLGVATPDDVIAHATPEVLSLHLPRAVWTQLLAACLAAPRTDARLIVDTVTVPVLCEHVPEPILWACLAQLGSRALGRGILAPPPPKVAASAPAPTASAPVAPVAAAPTVSPPVAAPVAVAPTASAPIVAPTASAPVPRAEARTEPPTRELPAEVTRVAPAPSRPSTASRAQTADPAPLEPPPRPASAARTTLGARRPQAAAAVPAKRAEAKPAGRAATATDFDLEADVEGWKKDPEQIDDDQLIDWSQNEETMTGGEGGFNDRRR